MSFHQTFNVERSRAITEFFKIHRMYDMKKDLKSFLKHVKKRAVLFLYRLNKTIFMQFCRTFLNGSAFDVSQVAIIGKPTASLPNYTNVDFAVILRPASSSKPVVVVNTTLEHIARERADSISKHLGGYETVFVNNLHPVPCDNETGGGREVPPENRSSVALAIGISIPVAIVLLVFTVWCR